MGSVLDRIESFGERMYRHRWYRVLMLVFIFFFVEYTALWCHEFMHYWYATAILKTKAYIQYYPSGMMGWCYVESSDVMLYFIGGAGTALLYFVFWFLAASFPNKLSLPFDVSLFYVSLWNFLYAFVEAYTLGMGHPELYEYLSSIVHMTAIVVTLYLYLDRVIEFIEVGSDGGV